MIYYSTLDDVKKYREHPYISQSELKHKGTFKENLGMVLGTYLDCLVTMPNEDVAAIIPSKRPSKSVEILINQYIKKFNPGSFSEHLGEFLSQSNVSFYNNLPLENRIANFEKKAKEWFDFLLENKDKFLITEEERDTLFAVKDLVDSVLEPFLINSLVFFQKDFYWFDSEHQLGFKGLADVLVIKDNELIEIDLKYTDATTLDSWGFICKELMYPIQKSFYKRGLLTLLPQIEDKYDVKIDKFSSYWLVASENFVQLVPVSDKLMDIGYYGYQKPKQLKLMSNPVQNIETSYYKKGILELIKDYKSTQDNPESNFEDKFLSLL